MRPILPCLVILACLTACDTGRPGPIGEQAMADGDWGWNEGTDCRDLASIVRLGEDRIAFIERGQTVRSGNLVSRELVYSDRMAGTDGRLESTRWTYNVWDENHEALQIRDTFTVRYLGGQFKGLTFAVRDVRGSGERFRRERSAGIPSGTLMPCLPAS